MAAERTVTVRIKAEYRAFQADMKAAARAAQRAAEDTEKAGKKSSSALGQLMQDAKQHEQAWNTAGNTMLGFGAAVVGAVGLSVKKYAEFDKAMSSVQAATHETAGNMDLLREAAVDAGADTAFSATEAAGAIEELAKAGVSTKDILGGGLTGALSLAAAGELDVGKAAEIAASALTQFKLEGSDVGHVADLLAAGAGKAQGSVEDLGMALDQSGLVAASTGLTIEETTGGLAAFASAGLTGSDAGTSFKSMLQRLTPQSEKAAKLMDELGVSAYDSQGNFVGLSEYAGILQNKLAGMTVEQRNAALATLFGSDAVRAANVLYEEGAEGIEEWEGKVNAAGYAAKTAAIKQDNLAGDLEKLGGAFDTVFIQGGSGVNGALRGMVQGLEGFVDTLGKIDPKILSTATSMAGIVGGAALVTGGLLKLAPAAVETWTAFRSLGKEGSKLPGRFGKIAKAAGIATAAIAGLQIAGVIFGRDAEMSATNYAEAMMRVAEAGEKASSADLDSLFTDWDTFAGYGPELDGLADTIHRVANPEFGDGLNQAMDGVASFLGLAKSEAGQAKDRIADLGDEMGSLVSSGSVEAATSTFRLLAAEFQRNGKTAQDALNALPGFRDALQQQAIQAGGTASEQELLNWAMGGAAPAAIQAAEGAAELDAALAEVGVSTEGVVSDMQTFLDLLFQTGVLTMSSRDAQFAYQEQLRGVDDVLKKIRDSGGEMGAVLNKNKTDFNQNTEAGKLANDTLQGLANGGMERVRAMSAEGLGQDKLQAKLSGTYQDLVATGKRFGLTADAARNLARKVLGIPDGVTVDSWMSSAAREEAERTKRAVNSVDGLMATITQKRVTIYETKGSAPPRTGKVFGPAAWKTGGKLPGFDGGGQLPAYGLGTDTILGLDSKTAQPVAWLDDEEWVINGKNSRKYDRELAAINAGTFPKLPGYADGRAINAQSAAAFDAGPIAAAVSAAISRYQPVVSLGGREFYGVMRDTEKQFTRR